MLEFPGVYLAAAIFNDHLNGATDTFYYSDVGGWVSGRIGEEYESPSLDYILITNTTFFQPHQTKINAVRPNDISIALHTEMVGLHRHIDLESFINFYPLMQSRKAASLQWLERVSFSDPRHIYKDVKTLHRLTSNSTLSQQLNGAVTCPLA